MKKELAREGIQEIHDDLARADGRLQLCERRAQNTWRIYLGGLAGLLVAINLLAVQLPLGVSLAALSVAAAAYGRLANRRARQQMGDMEAEIYRLKEALSKLHSLLEMTHERA